MTEKHRHPGMSIPNSEPVKVVSKMTDKQIMDERVRLLEIASEDLQKDIILLKNKEILFEKRMVELNKTIADLINLSKEQSNGRKEKSGNPSKKD